MGGAAPPNMGSWLFASPHRCSVGGQASLWRRFYRTGPTIVARPTGLAYTTPTPEPDAQPTGRPAPEEHQISRIFARSVVAARPAWRRLSNGCETGVARRPRRAAGRPSAANFETWLKDTSLEEIDEHLFRISAPNGFTRDWLDNRHGP